ncbi:MULTISPECIES: methionine ABC transporter permease [Enterococcus]|uniref:Binding-protein-dependent transport system inner membrane component n=1 Tax=Enterococcus mundtii TaxID=53346 RepID=A0AAI8WA84_ENTMU|nr:methionine ABC transporter permease [Enterococcus mundtii]MCA6773094.1 ABC transporter permease [Enterococcus mundtii]MRI73725.1 ABC transporter permease [Enterococcus mundtii]OBS62543.1 methionine ABC transporter permease [Enterococcus mundtii]QCJ57105.1 ABC transporter permease [Enterococcus mundtii]UBM04584.1 ABC transporter permease [Enterococcus mundtii]
MTHFLETYLPNVYLIPDEFIEATKQTLYMSFWTALIGGAIGLGFGIVLVVTRPQGLLENRLLYEVLDKVINVVRSIPFIILLSLLALTTRFLVGTTIGAKAALVPLIFGVVPFFARQVENALLEVDPGVIEAAESMGTSPIGIVFRVYLIEGLPGIIRVSALTIINVIGLTAMAGAVGAGGLGNLAISRGYNRFQTDVTIVATLLILILVFLSQWISNLLIKKISH